MALEIYAYKCKKCGQLHYPFRMVCKKCGKNDFFEFETVPLPKKGKLLTFTTVHNLPPDFNVAKLGLGIVELENGVRITGQLKVANPKLGMPVTGKVEIVREAEYSRNYGMVFYPGVMLLSIGDQVKPGSYRLHSVFQRAVNFEHRGRLVSVVDETIGPGPLNIVFRDFALSQARDRADRARSILKGLHPSAQGWIAGARGGDPTLGRPTKKTSNPERVESRSPCPIAPLQITPCTVLFAGHRYRFTPRHRYDSTLPRRAMDPVRLQRNLSALRDVLNQDAPSKSLAFLLDGKRRKHFRAGFERAYAEQAERGVRQVFHGDLLKGIGLLKGCGLGLTPGGDDFIGGLLIGLHLLQELRDQNHRGTITAIFRAARGKNLFSNTFLDLARRGLVFGRMKDLILALGQGGKNRVRQAAGRLIAVGGTSGADLATGLFTTLDTRAGSHRNWSSPR